MRVTTTIIASVVGFLSAGCSLGYQDGEAYRLGLLLGVLGDSGKEDPPHRGRTRDTGQLRPGEPEGSLPAGAGGRRATCGLAVVSGSPDHLTIVPAARGRDLLTRGLLSPALVLPRAHVCSVTSDSLQPHGL